MAGVRLPLRPRLAYPFTGLASSGRVRLVAGEEFRFTLAGPGLDEWLPAWLPLLDGRRTLDEVLAALPEDRRATARLILERLLSERVLIDGELTAPPSLPPPRVLTQDRLDLAAALSFNAECLRGESPWMWVTTGPMGRGYVSPVFLPDDGPCLACLLGHFRRLSPMPEIHDELIAHVQAGGRIEPVPFPGPGAAVLARLAEWKASLLAASAPAAFRLHVLEVSSLEVSSHDVAADPECPACHGRR